MSWSVSATGMSKAVATAVATQFTRLKCEEPEETIKNNIASIIAATLAAYPDDMPVTVAASGSQNGTKDVNTVNLSITPHWNFLS